MGNRQAKHQHRCSGASRSAGEAARPVRSQALCSLPGEKEFIPLHPSCGTAEPTPCASASPALAELPAAPANSRRIRGLQGKPSPTPPPSPLPSARTRGETRGFQGQAGTGEPNRVIALPRIETGLLHCHGEQDIVGEPRFAQVSSKNPPVAFLLVLLRFQGCKLGTKRPP